MIVDTSSFASIKLHLMLSYFFFGGIVIIIYDNIVVMLGSAPMGYDRPLPGAQVSWCHTRILYNTLVFWWHQ
jgi:hypothetical protein